MASSSETCAAALTGVDGSGEAGASSHWIAAVAAIDELLRIGTLSCQFGNSLVDLGEQPGLLGGRQAAITYELLQLALGNLGAHA